MFWKRDSHDYAADYLDPEGTAPGHRGKALGYGSTMAIGAFALWTIVGGPTPPKLGDNLCPVGAVPATHVVVLVDKTDEYTADQQRSLASSLRAHERELRVGERLSIYQMTPGGTAVVRLLYDRCRPKTGAEADPKTENPRLIERAYQEQFVRPLQQALATLTLPEPSEYSPLIEALYAVAHDSPLADKASRRVVEIWSDMLAKSELIDQYRRNYSFEQLRRTNSLYLDVPNLGGSEVRIYQLANRYPKHQNNEHTRFWGEYFRHAGVEEKQLATRRL